VRARNHDASKKIAQQIQEETGRRPGSRDTTNQKMNSEQNKVRRGRQACKRDSGALLWRCASGAYNRASGQNNRRRKIFSEDRNRGEWAEPHTDALLARESAGAERETRA
jgi:hypothetical protein